MTDKKPNEELRVDVSGELAQALEEAARRAGCTVEELMVSWLADWLENLSARPE